jgi:hypothetical protein
MTSLIVKENLDSEVNALQKIASNANASGLYNAVGGEAKIFMILMSAKELGIPPMQALNGGIWNIQGKVELSARMVNAMLRKAGIKITIKRLDGKGCILHGTRPDTGDECTVSFLEEEAKLAGVLGRPVWKSHPEDMYFARAMSKLGRRLGPDILGTAYVEGEIAEENERHAVSPENLPIAEVAEILQNTQDEVEVFVAEFKDDMFKEYFEAVCSAYSPKGRLEIVELLRKDINQTLTKFEAWKARQKKAA